MSAVIPMRRPDAEPHNRDAEQALLGAILMHPHTIARCQDVLRPEHFFYPVHGRIYAACIDAAARAELGDAVTMRRLFEDDPDLENLGRGGYVASLAASITSVQSVPDYARNIVDLSRRRNAIATSHDTIERLSRVTWDDPVDLILSDHRRGIEHIESEAPVEDVDFQAECDEWASDLDTPIDESGRIVTGLPAVDEILIGIDPTDLAIVGAPPSMGKTALGCSIAINALKRGNRIVFNSREMSRKQIIGRLVSIRSGIAATAIRERHMTAGEFAAAKQTARQIGEESLTLVDLIRPTDIAAYLGRCAQMPELVIIDYIQLMRPDDERSNDSRATKIGSVANDLKTIAKRFGVAIILLSQVSREVAKREDKRPMLSDLKESGDIENAADHVLFVHRPEYYLDRMKPDASKTEARAKWGEDKARWQGRAEIIVAKNRHGPIGIGEAGYHGPTCHFRPLTQDQARAFAE